MVDAGGEIRNLVLYWENAFLDAFSKNIAFCLKCFLFSRKKEGPRPTQPTQLHESCCNDSITNTKLWFIPKLGSMMTQS